MPDTSKLEKLNQELEKSEKKLRKAINDEKALQHQLKQLPKGNRTGKAGTLKATDEAAYERLAPETLADTFPPSVQC